MEATIGNGKNESPLREQGARSKTGLNHQELDGEKRIVAIPEDVNKFILKCGVIVGNAELKDHIDGVRSHIINQDIASPIEQLFEAATRTLIQLIGEEEDIDVVNGELVIYGISIRPQYRIGKYVVDYLLSNSYDHYQDIVVELDGHAFHDKDERQRRYEKKRDRYMQKLGYKVFRYTGAEIVANPFDAAIECISNLSAYEPEEFYQMVRENG